MSSWTRASSTPRSWRQWRKTGLYVRSILITHAHNAHINGIRALLKVYDAEIYANQPSVLDFPAHRVKDGDVLSLGGFSVRVIETPGHSIDSLCFEAGSCGLHR